MEGEKALINVLVFDFPQNLEYKPVPLTVGEDKDYMLLLKQEFRSSIRSSPYFIKPEDKKKGK